MMKKVAVVTVALAVAFSATAVWAGAGQRSQARSQKKVMDGTCLRQGAASQTQTQFGLRAGKHYGPGDGTGNSGVGPRDGSGYGKKAGDCNGTGTCDGSGPNGAQKQVRKPGGRR
jgi:hypothetical protein